MLSETFIAKKDAEAWARRIESEIDAGKTPARKDVAGVKTFGALVDLHIEDMKEVGRPLGRTKAYSLELLKNRLGRCKFENLDRERIIQFGKDRASEGAGPVTVSMDIGYIRTLLTDGAAIHGLPLSPEQVDLARTALKRLGLVGKSNERDRRPTDDELEALFRHFRTKGKTCFPMERIIKYAIGSCMRLEEICTVEWPGVNPRLRTLLIRDRKDPRDKAGNDQHIPLLSVSGYDAWDLLMEQRQSPDGNSLRVFPYKHRSVGTAFHRACVDLGIEDLHFHDLRHEGTSRLFEAGFRIEQAALVTGHKDWKMLRRYTHLRPEHLHLAAKDMPPRQINMFADLPWLATSSSQPLTNLPNLT